MATRLATVDDVPAIADLVNRAFAVERFFKIGDRTTSGEIGQMMHRGAFLLAERGDTLAGCVFVRGTGAVGYFGMLSIEPRLQGQGIGRAMVDAAEEHLRRRGCAEIEIHVVNLRGQGEIRDRGKEHAVSA